MSIRSDLCARALRDLGSDPRPEFYGQWCGQQVLAWLHDCNLALDIDWRMGGGFVLEHPEAFPRTRIPRPGDIGVSSKDNLWHYVMVLEFLPLEGRVITIAGNTGASPGRVGCSTATVGDPQWTWYSIEPVEAYP